MEHSESSTTPEATNADKAKRAFAQFLFDVASLMTIATVRKLGTVLNYSPADIDEAERDSNPGYFFVKSLREKGIINPSDISTLLDSLKAVGLQGVYNDVLGSFKKNVPHIHLHASHLPSDLQAKIASLITGIKRQYHFLYNAVQPIPYVRERLMCVNKEFIDSGVEFCNKKGSKEVWVKLDSYHSILTDPRLESTRFILIGEPGFGKSTLALQLAYDWCNRSTESALRNVQILILLRLRELSGIKSVFRAIKQFLLPHDSQLTVSDITEILCGLKSVVFVFDGFDEYGNNSARDDDDDIIRIISGKMFNEFPVILTTRPPYRPKTATPTTVQLKLTGFDSDAQEKYIQKAIVIKDNYVLRKIKERLGENPILRDLCEVPLFFVLFANVVHEKKKYVNFDSVTNFFQYMIACFHEHMKNKLKDSEERKQYENLEKDHRKLDEVAFAALSGNNEHMVWMKNKIMKKLGRNFYNQCIEVGILVEEERLIINNVPGTSTVDVIQRVIYTRFFHKIFCEWYAAHFLSSFATKRFTCNFRRTMKKIDPFELQYVFRFACGINPNASSNIIKFLHTLEGGDKFAILCILERTGSTDDIKEYIRQLCREGVVISGHDTLLLQRSSMQLLEIAAKYEIPIECVELYNCFQSVDLSSANIRTTSGLVLTSKIPFQELEIDLYNRELTVEEYVNILEFSSMCSSLQYLTFDASPPPRSFNVGPTLFTLCSRKVTVTYGVLGESADYILNLSTGRWEREDDGLECTDEDFQRMNLDWAKVKDATEEDYKLEVQMDREVLRLSALSEPEQDEEQLTELSNGDDNECNDSSDGDDNDNADYINSVPPAYENDAN